MKIIKRGASFQTTDGRTFEVESAAADYQRHLDGLSIPRLNLERLARQVKYNPEPEDRDSDLYSIINERRRAA